MVWQQPKTNWAAGNVPSNADFNRIEGNTEYNKDTHDNHVNNDNASTTKKGHVQLQTTVDTSETKALTPKALKTHADTKTAHGNSNPCWVKFITGVTISTTGWVDDTATSGYWYYDISNADINTSTVVDVNVQIASLKNALMLTGITQSMSGKVRIYSYSKPTANIVVDMKLTKVVA